MSRSLKIIIIGVLLTLGIGGLILYFVSNRGGEGENIIDRIFPTAMETPGFVPTVALPKAQPTPGATEVLGTIAARSLEQGALFLLSADPVSSLAVVGTTTRYHKNIPENLGHLFERKADGSDSEIRVSNFTIPQVQKVVWSHDAKRAVLFYNLDETIRKILVEYAGTSTPKTNFLPDTVEDVAFSPDSRSLAYVDEKDGSANIFIAAADFRNPRKIFDNTIPRLGISWPTASLLSLETKSAATIAGFTYTLNAQSGELRKMVEGMGLTAILNSDGSGALYSSGKELALSYLDIKSSSISNLGIKAPAQKCVFSVSAKNIAYCAVPKNLSKAAYPDAWWQGKVIFDDTIIMIDTATKEKKTIKDFGGDATHLTLAQNDSYLLFIDKTTGALWSLKLK